MTINSSRAEPRESCAYDNEARVSAIMAFSSFCASESNLAKQKGFSYKKLCTEELKMQEFNILEPTKKYF